MALLFAVVALAGGPGNALATVGTIAVLFGLGTLVLGHAHWARIATRKSAGIVIGAGLLALIIGANLASPQPHAANAAANMTSRASAPAPAASHVHTSTRAARAVDSSSATASASPTQQPASPAPATTNPAPLPSPVMAITCPSTTSAHATFGHAITAAASYSVAIDYGDGGSYTGDAQHLAAIFSHIYTSAGTYTVNAVLSETTGESVASTCSYTYTAPAVITSSGDSGSSSGDSSGIGGSEGGSSDTYINSDGNQVHDPVSAPSAPLGATARCRDGDYSYSQHHSGTCSGHGGVASWL